ncbi:putative tRNA pseudouridine synthase D [uncultured archaeon]|nr:putative tRNA pseudouridine synthase D [uncultured archaeon]
MNYLEDITPKIVIDRNNFTVQEITPEGETLDFTEKTFEEGPLSREKKFSHFILEKTGFTTQDAFKKMAIGLHIPSSRFDAAGMKDKEAHTVQLASVFGISPTQLKNLQLNQMKILGAWLGQEKIRLGDLQGNQFTFAVDTSQIKEKQCFPNYFGLQRFGSQRLNTHLVGKLILQGKFEDAVMNYLCFSGTERNQENIEWRKKLLEEHNFKKSFETVPRTLGNEKILIKSLVRNEKDFVGALRQMPRNIMLMFIHSYQSHLFNYFLKKYSYDFKEKIELVGYESEVSKEMQELLDEEEITKESFKIKSIPELSSKGEQRNSKEEYGDLQISEAKVSFKLKAGAYATVGIKNLMN